MGILKLNNYKMKPIRELANDREAILMVLEEIWQPCSIRSIKVRELFFEIHVFDDIKVKVFNDGHIISTYPSQYNPFKLVKLLTELGYEPEE